jgi:hypothetical protein
MKALASILSALWIAGCAAQPADDYPIRPQGIPPIAGGTSNGIGGRVCVIADPRDLTTCSADAAGGLNVTMNGTTTTTTADGSFSISPAAGGVSLLGVTGPGMVPTHEVFTPGNLVPVLRADVFSEMLAVNGATQRFGSGSILGTMSSAGLPASGVTVTSTPASAFGPFFAGSTPTTWTLDPSGGGSGVVWIPGLAVGPTQLTFRDLATSGETTVDGVQVMDGGITIVNAALP